MSYFTLIVLIMAGIFFLVGNIYVWSKFAKKQRGQVIDDAKKDTFNCTLFNAGK